MARLWNRGPKATLILNLLLSTIISVRAGPEVKVLNGTYAGLHLPEFRQDIFLGIPYAQDTGGQNRFRPPQALNEVWEGTREAKQYGHACPDEDVEGDANYGMSENCLSINVVRPAGVTETHDLPVMFWIHGGRSVISFHSGHTRVTTNSTTWPAISTRYNTTTPFSGLLYESVI